VAVAQSVLFACGLRATEFVLFVLFLLDYFTVYEWQHQLQTFSTAEFLSRVIAGHHSSLPTDPKIASAFTDPNCEASKPFALIPYYDRIIYARDIVNDAEVSSILISFHIDIFFFITSLRFMWKSLPKVITF
jgi:hypothetical protein